jgi:hypothetical protein
MITRMKSKGPSAGALLALGIVGALLVSGTPADAHKKHGKQDKHGQNQPKNPQSPAPSGPVIGQWHATRQPVAVRDHRPTPVVRDQRAGTPVVRDQRGGGGAPVKVTGDTARQRGQSAKSNKACVGSVCVSHPKLGAAIDRSKPR